MVDYESVNSTRSATISTDDVFRGSDTTCSLTSNLFTIMAL